jgi:hypothetical protein
MWERRKVIDLKTGRVGILDGYGIGNSAGSSEGIEYSDGERGFVSDNYAISVSDGFYERMSRMEAEMKRVDLNEVSTPLANGIRQLMIEIAQHEARHARIKSMFDLD